MMHLLVEHMRDDPMDCWLPGTWASVQPQFSPVEYSG